MKNKLNTILLFIALIAAPVIFTGCTTTGTPDGQSQQVRLNGLVKMAAYLGTTEALRQHPEWRMGFELAHNELKALEGAEKLDFVAVLAIVNRLPVKELKSDRATMFITAGTILLNEQLQQIDFSKIEKLRPTVISLREGIGLGLGI